MSIQEYVTEFKNDITKPELTWIINNTGVYEAVVEDCENVKGKLLINPISKLFKKEFSIHFIGTLNNEIYEFNKKGYKCFAEASLECKKSLRKMMLGQIPDLEWKDRYYGLESIETPYSSKFYIERDKRLFLLRAGLFEQYFSTIEEAKNFAQGIYDQELEILFYNKDLKYKWLKSLSMHSYEYSCTVFVPDSIIVSFFIKRNCSGVSIKYDATFENSKRQICSDWVLYSYVRINYCTVDRLFPYIEKDCEKIIEDLKKQDEAERLALQELCDKSDLSDKGNNPDVHPNQSNEKLPEDAENLAENTNSVNSIFENEYWIMAMCPRWKRKKRETVRIKCPICDGKGYESENREDFLGFFNITQKKCKSCKDGFQEVLKKIPPPPEFDQKFLQAFKEFWESYPSKEKS